MIERSERILNDDGTLSYFYYKSGVRVELLIRNRIRTRDEALETMKILDDYLVTSAVRIEME